MGNQGSIEPIPYPVEVSWREVGVSGEAPLPREGHAAALVGRKLYVFGGAGRDENDAPAQYGDLHSLDLDSGTWSRWSPPSTAAAATPAPRAGGCLAAVDGKLYLFGGMNMEDQWLSDLHIFDTEKGCWQQGRAEGRPPSRRDKACCCAVGKKIYIIGGFGPVPPPSPPSASSEEARQQQQQQETSSSPSESHPTAESNDEEEEEEEEEDEEEARGPFATFGWFDDVHVLDAENMKWEQPSIHGPKPTPRAAAGLAAVGSSLYLFGGRDTTRRQNDLHVLDTTTMTWQLPEVNGMRPTARSFHTFTTIGSRHILLFGGMSNSDEVLSDIHVFDTESKAWATPTIVASASSSNEATSIPKIRRRFHSSNYVWEDNTDEQKVLCFGGALGYDGTTGEGRNLQATTLALDVAPILRAGAIVPLPPPSSLASPSSSSSSFSSSSSPSSSSVSVNSAVENKKRKREDMEESRKAHNGEGKGGEGGDGDNNKRKEIRLEGSEEEVPQKGEEKAEPTAPKEEVKEK